MSQIHDGSNGKESLLMTWAHDVSQFAADSRKFGCLITNHQMNKVLAMGWNGGAKAQTDRPKSFEPGKSELLHAELNALLMLNSDLRGNRMFVTHSPCKMCAKAIVNAGIWAVYYSEVGDPEGLKILMESDVELINMFKK